MMDMPGLLIADEDKHSGRRLADLFMNTGYQVTVSDSVAGILSKSLKKTAQVILLSTRFDELLATELIPLLKKCNQNLNIILVANELPLTLIRMARREGIFYHALKPNHPNDERELKQVVKCAFEKTTHGSAGLCLQ